ncbi:MAG TPA: Na/Pi cotransporter family protein [Candidatus Barnesiella merdipullorum]|nr:Na/Pi cotransporter family protein [Candidatus Barnesiella merdipullorum]
MEYTFLDFLTLIGSVGLFLYGMKVMSEGLQKVAGDRLRNILAVMTKNRFSGMFTGILITALIQSSSASTVMVVSFVNAGLMTLGQSMSVIMGANVGTTVTAWIISIFGFKVNITLFALPLIGIGTPLLFFSGNSTRKSWGEFLIGFSFLFMGLDYLNHSVPDLKSNPEIFEFLTSYTQLGFLSILIFCAVGAIVTMIVQASSATLAISLIMCSKGWITFDIAAALILGSNIGTTITPLLASISANVSAKRAAMGHLLFNVLGSIWTLVLYYPFIRFIVWICTSLGVGNPNDLMAFVEVNEQTHPSLINALNNGTSLDTPDFEQQKARFEAMQFSVSFGLSMFHTVFNVINVTIMIWFTGLYEKIVTRLVRVKDKTDEEFQLKFISRGMLSASELNLPQAHQEIAVYAERVQRMFGMVGDLLHEKEGSEAYMKLYNRIEKYEQICDRMELEIAGFLNLVVGGRLSYEGKMRVNSMLSIVTEIESIGDCCYNLARTLQRKQDSHIVFNDEIVGNIDAMFKLNAEALSNMVALLSSNEPPLSEIMISYNKESEINNFRNQLRKSNIENINNKHYEYQAGIYYMDMISECERLGDYVINVVDAIKQQHERHA